MSADLVVPAAAVIIAGLLGLAGNWLVKKSDREQSAEQAGREALDEAWGQRVIYRDEKLADRNEQIEALEKSQAELRLTVVDLNAQIARLTRSNEDLTAEIARLTAEVGGHA